MRAKPARIPTLKPSKFQPPKLAIRSCTLLGRVLHRPSRLPVPGFALHLALGELGTFMTTGRQTNPAKALSEGYIFHCPTLGPILRAIVTKG
jgi:hypothetical protein